MRYTVIESVEGNWRMDLGSDVMIVGAVQDYGTAKDFLVYEAKLTGEEVLRLIMSKSRTPHMLDDDIVKDHHYVLTAYDD